MWGMALHSSAANIPGCSARRQFEILNVWTGRGCRNSMTNGTKVATRARCGQSQLVEWLKILVGPLLGQVVSLLSLRSAQTVNIDNPCYVTDPPKHGLIIISDNPLGERYIRLTQSHQTMQPRITHLEDITVNCLTCRINHRYKYSHLPLSSIGFHQLIRQFYQ